MKGRKHISWKTRCAAAVLDAMMRRERFGLYPQRWYDDAKKMTEDQFLSLFHWDHNILHETKHEHRDQYWNLAPVLIREHREKTQADAKIIAKSRRIRSKFPPLAQLKTEGQLHDPWKPIREKRTIQSRGFDKTRSRKMSGKVVKRER
jgi:hypothetical protein